MGNLQFSSSSGEDSSRKKAEACQSSPKNIKSIEPAFDPRSPTVSISRTPIQIEVTPNSKRDASRVQDGSPNENKNSKAGERLIQPQARTPLKSIDPDSPKLFLRYKQLKGLHKQLKRNGYDPARLDGSTPK